jgi:hypothetical protein
MFPMKLNGILCLFFGVLCINTTFAVEESMRISKLNFTPHNTKQVLIGNFWEAMSVSDCYGIIESEKLGKKLKLVNVCPSQTMIVDVKLPYWAICQMRDTGKYIIPLSKKGSVYKLPGRNYKVPKINDKSQVKYEKIIKQYCSLNKDKEGTFLKDVLLNKDLQSLHYSCLRRISSLGEFNNPLSKESNEFWTKIYINQNNSVPFKRLLVIYMSKCNFLPGSPIFITALKDPATHDLAAMIFSNKNKKEFESLMLNWLNDKKLRKYSIMNSERMVQNTEFVHTVMKYFDPKNMEQLQYILPVLCLNKNITGEKYIKVFLTSNNNPHNFSLYRKLFSAILLYNPVAFTQELKQFLKNNRKNRFITNSSIYPTILTCLCKAGDADGYKMTQKYLNSLNQNSKSKNDIMKINMVLGIFRIYNPQINKFEKLKQNINEKVQASLSSRGKT